MEIKGDLNVSLGKYYFSYDDYKYYLTLSLLFESGRLYNCNNVKVITWKSTGFSAKELLKNFRPQKLSTMVVELLLTVLAFFSFRGRFPRNIVF